MKQFHKSLLVVIFLVLVQILIVLKLDYPPSFEQINLGILNETELWLLRGLSLGILIISTFLLTRVFHFKHTFLYWLFVLMSPLFLFLWISYPLEVIELGVVIVIFRLLANQTKFWIVAVALSITFLMSFNRFIMHTTPYVLSSLSLNNSQTEVLHRFTIEDNIDPHIYIPLTLRRLAYNKYFLALQNTANDALFFFDPETVFFQEVSPVEQKSPIIFYWPEILFFLFSLWVLFTKKTQVKTDGLILLLLIGLVFFLSNNNLQSMRLSILLWVVAVVLCIGLDYLLSIKNIQSKTILGIFIFILFYGFVSNQYDLLKRPLYWLDNKPVAYAQLLKFAKDENYQNYSVVYLTDIFGRADKYCRFYLSDCHSFVFSNFDLSKTHVTKNSLYLGFEGNFFGSQVVFKSPANLTDAMHGIGLMPLSKLDLHDNIANGYGQEVIAATNY